ncbi:hypothetical protein [Microbacterium sp. NPDC087591]|uniref:hypothetical protein n=1 Tax=Microbacterium sp. NPDC087591 TaxID=3364192 RepID=UPI003826C692
MRLAAIRDDDPVLVWEKLALYNTTGEIPDAIDQSTYCAFSARLSRLAVSLAVDFGGGRVEQIGRKWA